MYDMPKTAADARRTMKLLREEMDRQRGERGAAVAAGNTRRIKLRNGSINGLQTRIDDLEIHAWDVLKVDLSDLA